MRKSGTHFPRFSARRFWSSVCLATILCCNYGYTIGQGEVAEPKSQEVNSQIERVLVVSGTTRHIDSVPRWIEQIVEEQQNAYPRIPSAYFELIKHSLLDAFRPRDIHLSVVGEMKSSYAADRYSVYLDVYNSELVARLTDLQVKADAPEQESKQHAFVEELKAKPPTTIRVGLLTRLDAATEDSQSGAQAEIVFARALLKGLTLKSAGENRLTDAQVESILGQLKSGAMAAATESQRESYLYAFRDVSDGDLEKYVLLLEQDAVKWGNQQINEALLQALQQASERFIAKLQSGNSGEAVRLPNLSRPAFSRKANLTA
jgi:hypothetical protein